MHDLPVSLQAHLQSQHMCTCTCVLLLHYLNTTTRTCCRCPSITQLCKTFQSNSQQENKHKATKSWSTRLCFPLTKAAPCKNNDDDWVKALLPEWLTGSSCCHFYFYYHYCGGCRLPFSAPNLKSKSAAFCPAALTESFCCLILNHQQVTGALQRPKGSWQAKLTERRMQ